MSAESDGVRIVEGCTRELLLKKKFSDPREKLLGMATVCYELLKLAAEKEFLNYHSSVSTFEKEEYEHVISEVLIQLYEFLLNCLNYEKKNSPSKTLERALVSPKSLCVTWKQGNLNRRSGNKRVHAPEKLDDVYHQRWCYYRDLLVGVLRNRGRRVTIRGMRDWSEHVFSYGSKKLPPLRMDRFMESIDRFASAFKPTLKDEDFWRGEDVLYRNDGSEGHHEGPGADKLDQFCHEFWEFAAVFFGQEHLLELSMVMQSLPRLYTYFACPKEISLDDDHEEDQDGEEKLHLDPPSEASDFDIAERAVKELEARREDIEAVARTLCPRDRKLILMEMACLPDVEKAHRLGLKSSSSISEQTSKAVKKFAEANQLPSLTSQKAIIFYFENLVAIAEAVWLDEKKELETFGPLEKRI